MNQKTYVARTGKQESYVCSAWFENTIVIMKQKRWDIITDQLECLPFMNKAARQIKRTLYGTAEEIQNLELNNLICISNKIFGTNYASEDMIINIIKKDERGLADIMICCLSKNESEAVDLTKAFIKMMDGKCFSYECKTLSFDEAAEKLDQTSQNITFFVNK